MQHRGHSKVVEPDICASAPGAASCCVQATRGDVAFADGPTPAQTHPARSHVEHLQPAGASFHSKHAAPYQGCWGGAKTLTWGIKATKGALRELLNVPNKRNFIYSERFLKTNPLKTR